MTKDCGCGVPEGLQFYISGFKHLGPAESYYSELYTPEPDMVHIRWIRGNPTWDDGVFQEYNFGDCHSYHISKLIPIKTDIEPFTDEEMKDIFV